MTDLPGKAIHDFHFNQSKNKLFVHDTFGPKVEMPVEYYFREHNQMPKLEQRALAACNGETLDIGAAAGSHALELQQRGMEVMALDLSPAACEVMNARDVQNVACENIFSFGQRKFDTLLLLMNGIGIAGDLDGFKRFLNHARTLLNPGGSLLFDSSDIVYMYEDAEMPEQYYGEVRCRYEYQQRFTEWFSWLYIDKRTMAKLAGDLGWNVEVLMEDENHQYLAKLQVN